MDIEAEEVKESISLIQELKKKMEKDIADILKSFETATGLKPGSLHYERVSTLHSLDYTVHISINI